jgi:cystathionine beta-lyase/cystathionine gamma-synthase
MAAISTSLATFLRPGDHVVAQRRIFAQTCKFLQGFMRPFGVASRPSP